MAAIIAMAAIAGWAVLSGNLSYIITRGVSMNPVYYQDDLVFVVRSPDYRVGQIAAYRASTSGVEMLHRITGGDGISGYVFKGDNNPLNDVDHPTADRLIGRAVLHVPKGGVWLKPLLSPTGLGMMGFLIVGSGAAALPRNRREIPRGRRKKKVIAMAPQGGSWAVASAVLKAVKRLPPALRVVAALVVAMTLLALGLGVLGWMKPTVEQRRALTSGQSITYSYSAKVPKSAAYDGTTAASPDPIFRKLADHIDLHLRYQGPPGKIGVSIELSNDSGWRTVMQSVAVKSFSGRTYDSSVSLDLQAIDARAKAAVDATGIQSSSVTIGLISRVTDTGFAAFNAPVYFVLDQLRLTVSGGETSLVVKDAGASAAPKLVSREIKIFGHALITAGRARGWAMLFLIGAVAGAVAVFLVLRRDIPARTRAEIERRYPQLLVNVEPMPSPPGKPVVNVDNFPALVKLAEKYGQMILTWRRPEADDFVVRDEGITYRYRVPLDEVTLQNVELINRPSAGSHRRKASSPSQVS